MDAVKHISPRAEQLLSEYGLGYVKAEYKGNLLKAGLASTIFFPVGLLILVFFLPTLLSPSFTTDGNWLEQLSNLFPALLWGSCFLFMGIVGMIILVFVLWKGEQSIYLGDKGFITAHRRLDAVVRWEAVQEIRRHILLAKSKVDTVRKVRVLSS